MRVTAQPTYRATREAWSGQLLLPVAFFVVFTLTAIQHAGLSPWIGGLWLVVLSLVAVFDYAVPMLRNWLQVDDTTLDGSLDGRYFRIYWHDVQAAWITRHGRKPYLCLGSQAETVFLPLRFFDECAVWQAVRERVPAAALGPEAMLRLPDYRRWSQEREAAAPEADCGALQVVDHWLMQAGGWVGLTFCLVGLARAFQLAQVTAGLVSLGLAAGIVAVLCNWGYTEFDLQGIRRHTLLGSWQAGWEAVRAIDLDPFNLVMVAVVEGRARVIPGPWWWCGRGKKTALALLTGLASSHNIPLRRSLAAWGKILGVTRAAR
jgi:hypothetical protein